MTAVLPLAKRLHAHRFPQLRWFALAWLAVFLPTYWHVYGAWHFLMLCNLGVLLTVAGLWFDKPLLLSSQAVAAPGIAVLWLADAGTRVLTGQHLHGGTAYMWNADLPALVRVLSLYHLAWPLLLAWCLHRVGYDRRGFALQCAVVAAVFVVGLTLAPAAENLNYVVMAPGAAGPAAHPAPRALGNFVLLVAAFYLPTHRVIRRLFAPPAKDVAGL